MKHFRTLLYQGTSTIIWRNVVKLLVNWCAERIKEKDREATIILFPHWQGFDYRWVSPRIEEICKELVQSGIDYVIGQGPHMVNHMATVDNGLILYSIGNFVYNSPGRYAKMDAPPYSCIVRLEIEEEGEGWIFRTKLYPILSDNKRTGYQVRPIDQKEAEELLLILNQKSPSLALRLDRDDRGLFFGLQGGKPLMKESSKVSIFLTKIPIKKKNSYQGVFSTRRLMEEAFCKFGYRTEMKGEYLQVHIGHKKVLFFESQSSFVSHLSWKILKDKGLAREFFQEAGLAIAKGEIFAKAEKEKAALFAKSLPSYVVKPSDGRKGMGVTVGVTQEKDFSTSWDLAAKKSKKGILIEEYFKEGIEARYLSVWGKCVAVYEKIPPMVIGNGADTVEDLLKEKNRDRSNNPHLKKSLIQLNPNRIAIIEEQGFTLSSIPEKGQEVFIDWKGSISAGGDTQDCTEDAHPFFKQIAERAATAVPGLDIVGVDILAHDHRIEPTAKNYIIVEANTRPGLGGHLFPMHGEPRNVAGIIAEETIKSIDSLESSL